ncbi:hypothetical protein LG314_09105 [Agrococcus terreus]|uniref:hypothetical protein n=1 Tax=Agrococcus terreus TaxID=574649 RepID=UPI00384BA4EF
MDDRSATPAGPSGDTGEAPAEPSAEVLAELDRLDAASRAAVGEIAPQIALWRAVAALDHWVFIDRGDGEHPRPYALAAEPGTMLCVFSTADRATAAAIGAGLVTGGEPVRMFAIPLPAALDFVLSFAAAGAVGVTIDHPQIGAWSPLQNIAMLRQERRGEDG